MPVLFIGHGSPMNAIEKNDFTETLEELGKNLPKPKSILIISAHWCTNGTLINTSPKPKMIYDMYGFPSELYQVKYSALGSPDIANEVKNKLQSYNAKEDTIWGFDHGNWSIMLHLFPKADIPVFQMSIDYSKPIQYHFNLAKELKTFRENGVLIIGSGNLTHNLYQVDLSSLNVKPIEWALDFDEKIKSFIDGKNYQAIIDYNKLGISAKLSVPEPSHYIPMIYALGLQNSQDEVKYFYDKFHYGSLSMRSFIIN
ncbi:MAG: 4,5-DOPA dioxygenase extradiol [Ignavibacterium sp.]